MHIKELQKNWNEFARTDPLWAIITVPEKKGARWNVEEFFQTGRDEIAAVLRYVESLHVPLARRKALDFGCGVGRLTQALADHFDEVAGVDIAPSMLDLARQYNRQGDKCKYFLNERADLRLFTDNQFDFIYTNVVLQHVEPRYTKQYLQEFVRILAPGGLLVFQLPSEVIRQGPPSLWRSLKDTVKLVLPRSLLNFYHEVRGTRRQADSEQPVMEMHGIPRKHVEKLLLKQGIKLLDVTPDQSPGPCWVSFRYCVTKE